MSAPTARTKPISFAELSDFFRQVGGYYEMGNEGLDRALLQWKLLDEASRQDEKTARSFLKWSLTASFLQLMNALEWFASGVLLRRSSYLPAQTMQSYYYSIFFSYGSFLAIHGKGHYTVGIERDKANEPKAIRRELWLDEGPPPLICLKEKGPGGEHEVRANWFYQVFRSWDMRASYPAVQLFENDAKFHTGFRNMFTYQLSEMAEELHHDDTYDPISDEILLRLWNHDAEMVDYFPEEFWPLAHFKAAFDTHCKLVDELGGATPFTRVQEYLLRALISRHLATGLAEVFTEITKPLLARVRDAG